MKKIVIAVAILIMLMGGGVSVMKSLEIGPFAPVPGMEGSVEASQEVIEVEPVNVPLDPITVPVFQGDKISATLLIEVHAVALGDENASKIKKLKPRIVDIFFSDLLAYLPRLIEMQGELDVEVIQQRLMRVAKRHPVTKDIIHRLTIQSINDQPVNIAPAK